MGRRRLYVFGTIIIVGFFVGLLCMPGSDARDEEALAGGDADDVTVVPDRGSLPVAHIDAPETTAKGLFDKAQTITDRREKGGLLFKAYQLDPNGCWGGEAAAQIGNLCKEANEGEKARQWYLLARKAPVSAVTLKNLRAELDTIDRVVTPVSPAGKVKMLTYKAKPNDSLWKIARRYATTIGAIKKANNLRGDMIRVGKSLQVPKGPFDVVISLRRHTLQLLQEGKLVKVYSIGVGLKTSPTPKGKFVVQNKLVNPVWYSPDGRIPAGDSRNVLGTRWMGFNGRIGIHGTRKQDEHSIGTDSSEGCIRMRDAEAQELYEYLVQNKSKVTVVD
jgi:LysM repeat protein